MLLSLFAPIATHTFISCAANKLPNDFGPSQSGGPLFRPEDDIVYVQEEGLGMRVSSALGSSRGEAERLRAEQEMKEDAERENNLEDARENFRAPVEQFSRTPSERARRLAENLSMDSARPISRKQTADSQPLEQVSEVGETLPQSPNSRQDDDKASRIEFVPTSQSKGHGMVSKEESPQVDQRAQPSGESKTDNQDTPTSGLVQAKKPGDVPAPTTSAKRSVRVSAPTTAGTQKTAPASSSTASGPGSRSSVPAKSDRSATKTNQIRPALQRPVTKESSLDRVAKEPSRLSTARSNISTTSSTAVRPNHAPASRGVQASRRIATAPSGNTPRNDRPSTMATHKGEVAAERSKPEVGDKTARPGTSAVEVNNMKILEHALGVNPKLKSSPLARTARFGPASKTKVRATSPRPQERAATAASVAVSKDLEAPDPMKKRPPWNPSTLDTLYSPRKPDTSPPRSRDASPHKVEREESRGRDLGQAPAAPASSTRAERSRPSAALAKNHTARSPPLGRADAAGGKLAGSKASGRTLPVSSASTAAGPMKSDGEGSTAPKTGVNEESTSSMVDSFDMSAPPGVWRGDGKVEGEGVQSEGDSEKQVDQPLIPPEFQNLERPLTRRDERPNTRRDDRPGTRSGMEDRPATRGLEDRPTTRGHDGRRATRYVAIQFFDLTHTTPATPTSPCERLNSHTLCYCRSKFPLDVSMNVLMMQAGPRHRRWAACG